MSIDQLDHRPAVLPVIDIQNAFRHAEAVAPIKNPVTRFRKARVQVRYTV